jgi:hypothetical protein
LNQISFDVVFDDGGKPLLEKYDELGIVVNMKDVVHDSKPSSAPSALLIGNPNFDSSSTNQTTRIVDEDVAEETQHPNVRGTNRVVPPPLRIGAGYRLYLGVHYVRGRVRSSSRLSALRVPARLPAQLTQAQKLQRF